MRTLKFFVAALIIAAIAACGGGKFKSAVEYNDYIINYQKRIIDADNQLGDMFGTSTKEQATAKLDELTKLCSTAIDSVKAMEGYNDNTAFRDEAVVFFQFYKELSEKEYKEMLDIVFKEDITEQDNQRMQQMDQDVTARTNERMGTLTKVQQEFADANNMRLE